METPERREMAKGYHRTAWVTFALALLAPVLAWLYVRTYPGEDEMSGPLIVMGTVLLVVVLLAVSALAGLTGWAVARWGRPPGPSRRQSRASAQAALREARSSAATRR